MKTVTVGILYGAFLAALCSLFPISKYSTNFGQVQWVEFGYPVHIFSLRNGAVIIKSGNLIAYVLVSAAIIAATVSLLRKMPLNLHFLLLVGIPFICISIAYLLTVMIQLIMI